ncbi:hypothetical protein TVAG_380130 [Trichomonas vaginalis G3]|uniref:Uncharacterized protein n=1 Tax=Trichomonas vaginalis (strain ATCC PRA-98 / G3) TaxID=412133 RepID=A2DXF1_TRIV3|nr:hypothetical protein TVAGG3_0925370 [Trichomonas vaginalis G3]EAY14903.1 hypothetical protein TVAG_380130 [Trichomonas vaginalis G3]KAI5485429.1 hypothetical protein TVAGG3_0925370 [Trichomonas vaginalis G3]|eukprot:XP_001327126.1 hypothetical protein [Trichomonas vaginalis G3]
MDSGRKLSLENLSAVSSARSVATPAFDESMLTDVTFPLTKPFMKLELKEKESLFLKMYEETILFIRNKELKCDNTPIIQSYEDDQITQIEETREQNLESFKESETKRQLTQRQSKTLSTLPSRIDNGFTPTFDPLLNTNFTSKFTHIEEFKACISQILIENRAKKRIQQINQFLRETKPKASSSLSNTIRLNSNFSKSELLNVQIEIANDPIKFIIDPPLVPLLYPEINIAPHSPDHEFPLYEPTLIERFSLTPFNRTEINAFVPFTVTPPDIFPTVREEQPIQERVVPTTEENISIIAEPTSSPTQSARSSTKVKQQSSMNLSFVSQTSKIVQYPRETILYSHEPPSELVPRPIDLPDLDIEIGRSSIMALQPQDYTPMMMSGKFKNVAPFSFAGMIGGKLKTMSGPVDVDLREIEEDDDIDNINVSQNPKPITDFLTKPVETKNKSHILTEAIIDGQGKWKERQRESVKNLTESITAMNDLIHDKTVKVTMPDLLNFLQE